MHEKRRELGDLSRHAILDAAARLMAERGYEATSISVLSKETGLPSSSIYWHFGSKEGVLAAVMERGTQRFFQADTQPDWGDEIEDPSEAIEAMVISTGRWLLAGSEHGQFLQLQLRLRMSRTMLGDTVRQLVDQVRDAGLDVMGRAIGHHYGSRGDEFARRVGEATAAFGVAMIDGAFLTASAYPDSVDAEALLADAGRSIAAAAARNAAAIEAEGV